MTRSRAGSRRASKAPPCSCSACPSTRSARTGRALERHTFQFRDPLNRDRRFIPLRLDKATPRGSLAQFLAVDWRERSDDAARAARARVPAGGGLSRPSVRAATRRVPGGTGVADDLARPHRLRASASRITPTAPARSAPPTTARSASGTSRPRPASTSSKATPAGVNTVACHPDGTRALSASDDGTVRVWNLQTATCEHVLEGHTAPVWSVACHPDATHALSASDDRTVRVWNLKPRPASTSSKAIPTACWASRVTPTAPARSAPPTTARSASGTSTAATCEHVLEGHTDERVGRRVSPRRHPRAQRLQRRHGPRLEPRDRDLRARPRRPHRASVLGVACHPDGTRALSASSDRTVRVWNLETATCEHILEGHTGMRVGRRVSPRRHPRAQRLRRPHGPRLEPRQTATCESRPRRPHRPRVGRRVSPRRHPRAQRLRRPHGPRLEPPHRDLRARPRRPHRPRVGASRVTPTAPARSAPPHDRHGPRLGPRRPRACEHVLEGHTDRRVERRAVTPTAPARSAPPATARSASGTSTTATCEHVLEGHTGSVWRVACHPDGTRALSASARRHTSASGTSQTATCEHVLEGHTASVLERRVSPRRHPRAQRLRRRHGPRLEPPDRHV